MKYLKTFLDPARRKIFFKCYEIYMLSRIDKINSFYDLVFRETYWGRFFKYMRNCKDYIRDSYDRFRFRYLYNPYIFCEGSREYNLIHNKVKFSYNNDYPFVPDEWWLDYYLKHFGFRIDNRKYGRYSVHYYVTKINKSG